MKKYICLFLFTVFFTTGCFSEDKIADQTEEVASSVQPTENKIKVGPVISLDHGHSIISVPLHEEDQTLPFSIDVNYPQISGEHLSVNDTNYHSNAFLNFLTNPDALFSHPSTQILKSGRSTTVAKILLNQHTLVVKRYNIKDTWHWLRRSIRSTRAEKSWRLAHLLSLFGIPTAKPVAFIEKHFLGLRNQSYFVMDYIPGVHLGDYFARYKKDDAHFEKIAHRVIQLLSHLTQLNLTHGDLKVTNILIENDRPLFIDLDGMTEYSTSSQTNRAYQKEINRFMKNWDKRPSVKALFAKLLS